MSYRFNAVWLMFGAVSLCIIGALAAKPQANVVKPVGPRMCERLCKRTIGCSKYTYVIDDLSCQLIDVDSEDTVKGKYVVKAKQSRPKKNGYGGMKQCRKKDIKFRSRRNQALCRPRGPKNAERRHKKLTRLLMFPYYKARVQQFFLYNKSVSPCRFLGKDKRKYTAAAYISVSKKLAVATYDSFFFISLNDNYSKKVIRDLSSISIGGIAVDESKQIMFLASFSPRYCLYAMTTEGKNFKPIRLFFVVPDGIAADPKRSQIYVMFSFRQSKIVKFTYSGYDMGVVVTSKAIRPFLFVDFDRDILYYMIGEPVAVIQLSLENGSSRTLELGMKDAYHLYVWGSNMYVMQNPFRGKLFIFSENGTRTEIQTKFGKEKMSLLIVCGIPKT